VSRGGDRLSLLGRVAAVLRDRDIPFCIVGAAAMAVHGVVRSTLDIDVLVASADVLEPTTWDPLRREGIPVAIHRGDADDPLRGVVRIGASSAAPIDVIVGKARWQAAVLERCGAASIEGIAVPVVRAADLVLLKLYAAGPQDAWDVTQLLEAPGRAGLVAEVERGLVDLPAESRALWRRIAGDQPG
jgi:hypothetical protein